MANWPIMISVIVPTYLRPGRLRDCLSCLAAQTYRDLEVCIVNDGGPSVAGIVREFAGAIEVRLHESEVNRGHVASRNKALELACGDLIALCDDDDEYAPDHLDTLNAALPGRDLVYSGAVIRATRRDGGVELLEFSYPFDAALLRRTNFVVPSSSLYRKSLHDALGPFDEAADQYWDWDWVLRVAEHGAIAHVPRITLTYDYRIDGGNMSGAPERDRAKLRYLEAKHGLGYLDSTNFYLMARARTSPGSSPSSR
jgi:glycosyltransferase involved in cell wall biosynthesis